MSEYLQHHHTKPLHGMVSELMDTLAQLKLRPMGAGSSGVFEFSPA